MAVNIKITPAEGVSEATPSGNIKIKIMAEEPEPVAIDLVARRALNGDIMIMDHDLVDIVILHETNLKNQQHFLLQMVFHL